MLTKKMKDSGIEWIGEIPEDWKLSKIGSHYVERTDKVSDLEFGPLSVTKNGVVPQLETAAKSSNHNNRKLVLKDDFVINSRSDRKMSAGISDLEGSVSVINTVLHSKSIERDYTKYLMKNYAFAEEFYRWGTGIVDDLWSTKWLKMKNISIPLPPKGVQLKIGSTIDRISKNISNLISESQQSINDLKKYKQSLITEAVTKGLDTNLEMRDSGIEWVGRIPVDWELKKVRYFLRETSVKNHPDEEVLSLYRDYGVIPKDSRDDNHNVTSTNTSGYKLVNVNNVVINKMKAWQGSIAVSKYRGIVSPAYFIFEVVDSSIDFKFLHYVLRNNIYLDEYMRISAGLRIGQWDLNKNEFKNLLYPFPNNILDQQQIVSYLDEQTSHIDKLIEDKTKFIEELESYKQSLIYEYVTGKKEV